MADYKVRGRDERMHVFRHESPGKWRHYSRPIWEKYAIEREEDARNWTLAEVTAWIDVQQVAQEPVSAEEVKWVHNAIEKGYDGKAAVETEYPVGALLKCDSCGDMKPKKEITLWGNRNICKECRSSNGFMYGR